MSKKSASKAPNRTMKKGSQPKKMAQTSMMTPTKGGMKMKGC